jgi:MoaA/NifB/PqqE/SkfB family radical SAM enzyme
MSELRRLSRLVKTGASFMRGATEMSQLPLYYWIEPTSACNLRCIMCPTGLGLKRKPGMMDLGMFTRLLDEIGPLRPVINLHHSGEPLLHPQIHEMTRRARERGAFVGYFTNATKLDAPMRAKILDGPPNWIGFSFDGYDRETYESVRVKATWDEALGNIERFLAERRARGQKEPYTYLSTIEVPGQNVDWAAKRATFRAHLRSMGLDQMSVANTHTWAGSMSWLANGEVRQNSTCPFPWTGLGILWDGAVVPCCMDLEGSHPVGHLGEQSLWEVWNGEPMRDLRTKLSTKRAHEIPLCKDCTVLQDRAYFGVPARAWQDLFDVARTELHRALP